MPRTRAARLLTTTLAAASLFAGCTATRSRDRQLERVARDWAMTIRASQIIPVYPLTEDLQPGDVFLVQLPVDRQQEAYKQQGFLALDNLIARLRPVGYFGFYEDSFLAGTTDPVLPRDWLSTHDGAKAWSPAPNASFPSYSFSVRKGGGLNLAVPVQGVPVGLSLLASDAAEGTVLIADAKTYGLDTLSLYRDVETWGRQHRSFLANYASSDAEHENYVRVVSRAYLTKRVNVSLQAARSRSAGVSAGASKPVELIAPGTDADARKRSLEAYESGLKQLNTSLADTLGGQAQGAGGAAPGGTVKIVAASASSISLNETFPRPLVVGYLGFDLKIGADGVLGPPIPTHALLEGQATMPDVSAVPAPALARTITVLRGAAARGDATAQELVEDLNLSAAVLLPDTYPCNIYGLRDAGGPLAVIRAKGEVVAAADKRDFQRVISYRAELASSLDDLRTAPRNEDLAEQLACAEGALTAVNQGLGARAPLLKRARDHAIRLEWGD